MGGVPLPLGEGLWLPRSWGGERIDFAQHLCSWCGAQVNSKLMDFPDMCNSAAVANDSEHRKKCKGREKGRGKRGRGGEGGLQRKQETTRRRCRFADPSPRVWASWQMHVSWALLWRNRRSEAALRATRGSRWTDGPCRSAGLCAEGSRAAAEMLCSLPFERMNIRHLQNSPLVLG